MIHDNTTASTTFSFRIILNSKTLTPTKCHDTQLNQRLLYLHWDYISPILFHCNFLYVLQNLFNSGLNLFSILPFQSIYIFNYCTIWIYSFIYSIFTNTSPKNCSSLNTMEVLHSISNCIRTMTSAVLQNFPYLTAIIPLSSQTYCLHKSSRYFLDLMVLIQFYWIIFSETTISEVLLPSLSIAFLDLGHSSHYLRQNMITLILWRTSAISPKY